MTSRDEAQTQQFLAIKSRDLATPSANAAELASTLQKMPMNVLFSKVALFTGKWILRPIFWWPIKYYFILMGKILGGYVLTKSARKAEDRSWDDQIRRQREGTW